MCCPGVSDPGVFSTPGQESAGESFYMLFRAIKHQVDKGPVDAVTGKAKYTLNDNRLLREDVEYRTLVRATHNSCFQCGDLQTTYKAATELLQQQIQENKNVFAKKFFTLHRP